MGSIYRTIVVRVLYMERLRLGQPVLAGILTALVGFTSSSAVVLTGLRAVGASPAEAASGLLALLVTQGLGMLWLTRRHRIPLTLAWSTPGAAVLASTGVVHGGWPAAGGGVRVVGALIGVTGGWPRLGRLIAAIPAPIAQAMLAGVVLQLCLAPVRGFASHPWLVGPILLTWVILLRLASKWAIPAAFGVALVAIGVYAARNGGVHGPVLPHLDVTAPAITWAGRLSLALPRYVVTMAGQNVPGVAIMSSYGYQVPWRETMTVTGVGTMAGALAGGHAVNLAAITASMAASPYADPDQGRRWIASSTAGWAYLVLALLSAALITLVSAAPADVTGAVAGLALLGTLSASLAAALSATEGREAPAITFVVAASGLSFLGIGAAFWALVVGLLVRAVLVKPASELDSELNNAGHQGQLQLGLVLTARHGRVYHDLEVGAGVREDVAVDGDLAHGRVRERLAVLGVHADRAGVPQLREPRIAVECPADEPGQARVPRVPAGRLAQVGDERPVGGVGVLAHHRPAGEPLAIRRDGEPGADQVPGFRRESRRVAEQRRPAAVPPDQPPVGGEHRDGNVAKPGEDTLGARRNMVADHAVPRWLQPGETVQVVALGPGQLQGTGERARHLRRSRQALMGPPRRVSSLVMSVILRPLAPGRGGRRWYCLSYR